MNEDERAKTRRKVARWRARHREELQHARLMRVPATGRRGQRPAWQVTEFVRPDGLPVAVVLHRVDEVPEVAGAVVSYRWLPNIVASYEFCRRLRRARLEQIAGWAGAPTNRASS